MKKNILIIGGSSSIGQEVIALVQAAGDHPIITSRTDMALQDGDFFQLDPNDDLSQLDKLPESIDGLLYCPGSITLKSLQRMDLVDVQEAMKINFEGAFNIVKKVILTASGGPFRERSLKSLKEVTVEEALKHPNWEMGRKISIDSSTMMNKGLELVEAMWLFDKSKEDIEIVIHPESIIHSMVQFVDDSYKAHLGIPDMKIPIQYALSFPERIMSNYGSLNFAEIGKFTFLKPDYLRYPALELLTELITSGGNRIPIMSMANDLIVDQFLNEKILFTDIPNLLEKTVNEFGGNSSPSAEDLLTLNEQIKLYLV